MNSPNTVSVRAVTCLALLLQLAVFAAVADEVKPLRLAVGPYSAPVGKERLRQVSQMLPDLLLAGLSQKPRFVMVEREKAQAVWNELKAGASGLVARDTVAKLGHVLACDWVVSGSVIEVNGRTIIWTKVTDVRSGVVTDLNATTYEPGDSTKSVAEIATFLEQAGSGPRGRQFIAMGPFVDMNPALAPKREDWSKRIPAMLEKHFHDAGFGVVELAAVGPIFEERRLESAGLTGNPEGRVKMQPAFWLIDGGCEWNETAPEKLNIALRIQKFGAPEQMLRLTDLAGDSLERTVTTAIKRALANPPSSVTPPGPDAEADLLRTRGMEHVTLSSPFQPHMAVTTTPWDTYKAQLEEHKARLENREALIANYQRLLLRDPKNLDAKKWLGIALIADPDAARREQGKELLEEVAASDQPHQARHAKNYLARAEQLARDGEKFAAGPERPKDWASLNQAVAENPNDMEAKCDLGAAMLTLPKASTREHGRRLLAEVIQGDRPDQIERARKLLAEPEKSPAIRDEALPAATAERYIQVGSRTETVRTLALPPEDESERKRREFLQSQFQKFSPASFGKDDTALAKFQRVSPRKHLIEHDGWHYFGFRFTTPAWLDGDLFWMHLLAKSEEQKEFSTKDFGWYIMPQHGRMHGFQNFSRIQVADRPGLAARFPHTRTAFAQSLPKEFLEPGKEYAIWFACKDRDLPDIAFALTVHSNQGRIQFGQLPLQ